MPWSAHHFFYHGDLDAVLRHFIRPAVAELAARGFIDRFFFIRYTLGGPHVRLRCRLTAEASAVHELLHGAVARFLECWRSESSLDPERIRQESRAILDAVPEESDLYYENNSLVPFAFEPEMDRYGGPELLEPSLDFFAVSSAQALEIICDPSWDSAGRRGTIAMRLLLRQARGFAEDEQEFLSHLGYRLPLREEMGDEIWSRADRDFEARREAYLAMIRRELSLLTGGGASPLHAAAQRLSQAVRHAPPAKRWQIGHSQLHMTANRLGFFPVQEMYLQRILWRAACELAEAMETAQTNC